MLESEKSEAIIFPQHFSDSLKMGRPVQFFSSPLFHTVSAVHMGYSSNPSMVLSLLSRGSMLWLFWWAATQPLSSTAFRSFRHPFSGTSTFQLSATAMEQLKAQQAEARRMLREESVQRKYHEHLDKIAAGDKSAIKNLLDVKLWNDLSHGLTVSPAGYAPMIRRPSPLGNKNHTQLTTPPP